MEVENMKKYYVIYVRNANRLPWHRFEEHANADVAMDRAVNSLPRFWGRDNVKIEVEYH